MKELIVYLKSDDLISEKCQKVLESQFSGVPLHGLKRMLRNNGKGKVYDSELKSFALTLQFYSTKAILQQKMFLFLLYGCFC